jgi:LmbE family N-acetylglucosaminyl deacetylase
VATLVTFHAHPDDESIATGGLMAKAAADGHRVVLVTATRGEQGEPVPGILNDGEPLWERRVAETHRSAEVLGVERVEFLGYEDSGMMGEPTNDNPVCFWRADVEEAAKRLAAILAEVDADVLTIYDDHGGYGHPDHIQVHRVGRRAAALAGVAQVFQATMNRTQIQESMRERAAELEAAIEENPELVAEQSDFGSPEEIITHAVDVSAYIDRKRESLI